MAAEDLGLRGRKANLARSTSGTVRLTFTGSPGYELFEHTALLAQLLAPYPQVGIVLSTNWLRTFGYSRTVTHRTEPGLR